MKKILFVLLALFPVWGYAQSKSLLVLSDVHVALSKHWDTFYHTDTDSTLFLSATEHAKEKQYSFVIMPGDLLRHVGDVGHDTLEMKETYKFIIDKVSSIDTQATILPALGNNDCIKHDTPDVATYKVFYDALLKRIDGDGEIKKTFLTGGYYAYQKGNLTVMVLNSILFMRKNTQLVAEANAELAWMKQKLSTLKAGQSVWLVYHVPPGADRYDESASWQKSVQSAYLSIVKNYASRIKFQQAGHTHAVDARLLTDSGKKLSYVAIAPGLDSRNGNNPAYQLVGYNAKDNSVNKITTYYTDSLSNYKWHSFTFKDLDFKFFLKGDDNSNEGRNFIKHYTTCRGTTKSKNGKQIAWDDDFRKDTLVEMP